MLSVEYSNEELFRWVFLGIHITKATSSSDMLYWLPLLYVW